MWAADIGKQGTQDIKDKKFDWLFQRNQLDFFGWLLSPSLDVHRSICEYVRDIFAVFFKL